MRTYEQKRATDALKRVEQIDKLENSEKKKNYRAYVDRLGPTIVVNGLGQALASELAADDPLHKKLYKNLKGWLCRDNGVYPKDKDLLCAIMEHDESKYLRAQAEALAWLEWHKKFCRAKFPKGEDD